MKVATEQPRSTPAAVTLQHSPRANAIRRFAQHRLAVGGLIILLALTILSVFAPVFSKHSAFDLNLENRGVAPSAEHWFGTDRTGRDIWARTLVGGRASLAVGFISVSIATVIGIVVGSVAGYFGGIWDSVLMRITDMVMTFPVLLVVITIVTILGSSLRNTIIVIGLLSWPQIARLVRGEFLYLREKEFVLSARSMGGSTWTIIWRHILPNTVSSIAVAFTFAVANAILLEAGLSFLGLGIQMPTPSWGNMLRDAQSLSVLESMPWMWIPPGMMIILAVLAINFIGDGLRDILDPRTQVD